MKSTLAIFIPSSFIQCTHVCEHSLNMMLFFYSFKCYLNVSLLELILILFPSKRVSPLWWFSTDVLFFMDAAKCDGLRELPWFSADVLTIMDAAKSGGPCGFLPNFIRVAVLWSSPSSAQVHLIGSPGSASAGAILGRLFNLFLHPNPFWSIVLNAMAAHWLNIHMLKVDKHKSAYLSTLNIMVKRFIRFCSTEVCVAASPPASSVRSKHSNGISISVRSDTACPFHSMFR